MADRSIADRIEAVVIGTSAGGVEALSVVLPALPAGVCAPVFVVLHLPRERPSLLADIFAPEVRGCRCVRRSTRIRSSRARSISRRPTTTC